MLTPAKSRCHRLGSVVHSGPIDVKTDAILNFTNTPQQWIGPAVVAIIAVVLYFFEPSSSHWLAYNRPMLQELQWWRGLTGHFPHTNGYHLILNLFGVWLLWALHGYSYQWRQYLALVAVLALGISGCMYGWNDTIREYVGLSGLLHGLFVWGAITDIRQREKTGWLLLIGVVGKIAHEQYTGASIQLGELIDAHVMIDAHMYGAICGAVLSLALLAYHRIRGL